MFDKIAARYLHLTAKLFSSMPGLCHEIETPFQKATFGMGCFWACDALFGGTLGVLRTRVGYSGGTTKDPHYKSIGDHTEVIELDYDPKIVNYNELLDIFWNNHEYGLTTIVKKQYMSLILYHDEEQKKTAEKSMKDVAGKCGEKLITTIAAAGPFYPAEDYHQKYRLQEHSWVSKRLGLTAELLQTSHIACKLNGYLAGVGSTETVEKDLEKLNIPKDVADFVITKNKENAGGSLYC